MFRWLLLFGCRQEQLKHKRIFSTHKTAHSQLGTDFRPKVYSIARTRRCKWVDGNAHSADFGQNQREKSWKHFGKGKQSLKMNTFLLLLLLSAEKYTWLLSTKSYTFSHSFHSYSSPSNAIECSGVFGKTLEKVKKKRNMKRSCVHCVQADLMSAHNTMNLEKVRITGAQLMSKSISTFFAFACAFILYNVNKFRVYWLQSMRVIIASGPNKSTWNKNARTSVSKNEPTSKAFVELSSARALLIARKRTKLERNSTNKRIVYL